MPVSSFFFFSFSPYSSSLFFLLHLLSPSFSFFRPHLLLTIFHHLLSFNRAFHPPLFSIPGSAASMDSTERLLYLSPIWSMIDKEVKKHGLQQSRKSDLYPENRKRNDPEGPGQRTFPTACLQKQWRAIITSLWNMIWKSSTISHSWHMPSMTECF